jgi:hypothetical protein
MRSTLLTLLGFAPLLGISQYDVDLAYLPSHAPSHTADDVRVGFTESAVSGHVELVLPLGTDRVDLLNARGEVVDRLNSVQLERLVLDELKPGTWTLRAMVDGQFLVRRFVVLGKGHMAWIPEQTHSRKARPRR